jgi:ATP-dependent exoDNAse (exonuclease V) beta subunit
VSRPQTSKHAYASHIEIISASAGSGKTYRLATVLEDALVSGDIRPHAVLATTFTNKAAAELQERARTRLLGAGRSDDAQRLAAARIGTVNSVCGRIVSDFAFELGLPPRLSVLDEGAAASALRRASSLVLDQEETALSALKYSLGDGFDWSQALTDIVGLARTNGVETHALGACAARSLQELAPLLGSPARDARALDRALRSAIEKFVGGVDCSKDSTKKTAGALDRAETALRRLRSGGTLPWSEWAALARLDPGKGSVALAEPVLEAAAAHDIHPRLRADLEEAIRRVFSLAERTLGAYESYKRDWGLIDFADQEVLALAALQLESVRERLADELDLVLVDEFQDTSPLQLAIFLELGRIARRSVWVGDQKQAIFGFRGTDPALMDAAIEAILGGQEPETLPTSYRSRPELVRVTNALFAPAFAGQGIPECRVRLAPVTEDEPKKLGPGAEFWTLDTRNVREDAVALARCVAEMLSDENVCVRQDDRVVRVRAQHVAVLCRTHDACARVAAALSDQGIPAVIPSAGLLATPEALLVAAGLRLWSDPRDALARAELARLVDHPPDGDVWLSALLDSVVNAASSTLVPSPTAERVIEARSAQPHAGVLSAFDAVLDAVRARDVAVAWGNGKTRLANLDALRALAVAYVDRCQSEGAGCTPAGLIGHLRQAAQEGNDAQGVLAAADAVTISTWHAAKGLEWPVTVLANIDKDPFASAIGVRVVSDRKGFDLKTPLAERWLRYLPNPYGSRKLGVPFLERLAASQATKTVTASEERQALRLLYVGFTRARDRIVLAGRPGAVLDGLTSRLAPDNERMFSEPDAAGRAVLAGQAIQFVLRRADATCEPVVVPAAPGTTYVAAGPRSHAPATRAPSDVQAQGIAGAPIGLAHHLEPFDRTNPAALGNAVHAFFAADRAALPRSERLAIAQGLLERWQVERATSAEALLAASDALAAFIAERWPQAVVHREWPTASQDESGTVELGVADLVVVTSSSLVVIDHKTFAPESAIERARTCAGQLAAYGSSLSAATGKPVEALYVHLPLSGCVVPVTAAPR